METSVLSVRKYKIQTILFAIAFITLIFVSTYFLCGTPLVDTIMGWLVSATGVTVLVHFTYRGVENLQGKLNSQLTNSRRYSQRQTALASLCEGFAAAQSEDEICKELARRLQEVQGYDYVAVFLLDKSTGNRVLHANIGRLGMPDAITIPPGTGLSEQPILDGKLQYTPDVSKNPKYLPGLGQGSEVDVPIQFNADVMGVLVVENHETNAFGPDDFALLTTAADQAAIALQNARLLAVEQKRRHEAEILRNATMAVSSDLDLDLVLDHILTQLEEVVPFDSACVFLWKDDNLLAKAARGLPHPDEAIGKYFPADNELFQLVFRTNQPVILDNIQDDPRFQGWGGTYEMHSWMGVPLKVSNDIVGILTLDNREIKAYDQDKANLAQIFANQATVALQNAQLYQSAKHAAEKLIILHEASQKITSASFDPERTYVTIHEAASQLMPCEAFSISILDEKQDEIEAVYLVDRDGRSPSARIPAGQGLSGYIISTGEPLLIHDYLQSEKMKEINVIHFGNPDHIRAFIAVPMRLGDKVIGMLSAQSYQPHKYTAEDQKMLEMLAAHAAVALNNARLFAQVQRLALTDYLTDVHNRRFFFDIARREFFRACRYHHPLSFIMLDLDRYKDINDIYGHVIGDHALKLIARHIQENIRETDTLGRYGGDEFSILLPETDLDLAMEIAERLRTRIANTPIQVNGETITITISLGVSSTNENVTELAQLLLSADMALYDAKSAGRNCVRSRVWPFDKSTITNGEKHDC